jgi:hypothetical protein
MRKIFVYILAALLIASCTSGSDNTTASNPTPDTTATTPETTSAPSANQTPTGIPITDANFENEPLSPDADLCELWLLNDIVIANNLIHGETLADMFMAGLPYIWLYSDFTAEMANFTFDFDDGLNMYVGLIEHGTYTINGNDITITVDEYDIHMERIGDEMMYSENGMTMRFIIVDVINI